MAKHKYGKARGSKSKRSAAAKKAWRTKVRRYGRARAIAMSFGGKKKRKRVGVSRSGRRRVGVSRSGRHVGHRKSAKRVAAGKRLWKTMCARHGGKAGAVAWLQRRRRAAG
mgnify:CR=1 FL=1